MRLGTTQRDEEKTEPSAERTTSDDEPLEQHRGPLLCGEVLRRPVVYVSVNDTVAAAARAMREADVGFLAVCEDDGRKLVGVLTDRDIVTRACVVDDGASLATTAVKWIMTKSPLTVRTDDSVTKALRLMRKHQVSRLIVLSDAPDPDEPLGIVSLSDIAQYEKPARIGRTLRAITERKYAPERP